MSCENCPKTKQVPECLLELVVGKISDTIKEVYVVFDDITSNRTTAYPAQSDSGGLIKLDTSDIVFMENHSYVLTVVSNPGAEQYDIEIGGTSYECLGVRFKRFEEAGGDTMTTVTHTIEME